jgi:hypothetical protein
LQKEVEMDDYSDIHTELERAETTCAARNDGRAHVYARWAVGRTARVFLTRHEVQLFDVAQGETRTGSAYQAFQALTTFPGLAPNLKQAAVYLTMCVSGEFNLPPESTLLLKPINSSED